jgi:hypothetical protein
MAKELYERIDKKVSDLLSDVRSGRIGLPDLQRPFVWKDSKVRDLLDSMMNGFPVGYVMLWTAPDEYVNGSKIGANEKAYSRPTDLVIDGQQRLTSLLAAIYGESVKSKDFSSRRIRISFHPFTLKFEVWSQAFEKDTNYISDISKVYEANDNHVLGKYIKAVTERMNEGRKRKGLDCLNEEETEQLEDNIRSLLFLLDYTIPTLRIKTNATEPQVAEIFKRVNSGGQNLNENNFIETLLAVYDNVSHRKIMKFCEDSHTPQEGTSYNQILKVESTHLIRIAVGYGFNRARLEYAYKLLRGKDLDTGEITEETQAHNLKIFKDALDTATQLNNWHAYLNLFNEAGYLNGNLLSSKNVVVYGYVMYLVGKYKYNVQPLKLKQLITLWIFMTAVTSYFTQNTSETIVEKIFADLRNVNNRDDFVKYFAQSIKSQFTDDYFNVTLPDSLSSSAAISPAWYGYLASLNVLGHCLLFSSTPASKYWIAGASGSKSSIDKHHIFPKKYLEKIGISNDRDRNQIANFTFLDYNTNISISDAAPSIYGPKFRAKCGEADYLKMCEENALPTNFYELDYFDFLSKRRILMAAIVKKAYDKLRADIIE